ncbi:mavicyanin-like [Rhododendron vialii]|uniref:mavicyanin-like n=1 Tax=Rhododendron vialii TaxID=182163 RepID=UPI00265F459F|nr:mavicyanin-like [Rhododendron vialii]
MGGNSKLLIAMIVFSVAIGRGQWVGAQIHHVVGGDRGWDPSSDIPFWASTRIFSVGDKIWFTYSAAQENIVELKSKEEYEACDVSNPIKMYTNGLDNVPLEEEGIRYFASGKPESCKNGLRLHVEVQPQAKHHHISAVVTSEGSAGATADAPASPSASTRISGLSYLLFVGILLCHLINQGL